MFGQLLIATGLVGIGAGLQRWSSARRQDRRHVKQGDMPRWEDEGGAPRPEPSDGHVAADPELTQH